MRFEDKVGEVLKSKARDVDPEPLAMPDRVRSRVRRRVAMQAIAVTFVLAAVGLSGVFAASFIRQERASDVTETPDEISRGCPPDAASTARYEYTSPGVLVARGDHAGRDWILCARTVRMVSPTESGEVAIQVKEGLCMHWRYGSNLGSGMDCGFIGGQALAADYLSIISGANEGEPSPYFGAIPAATAKAEFHPRGGAMVVGTIYDAPRELGEKFKFLVGFIDEPPLPEVRLVLRDEEGDVIESRTYDPGLALLRIEKTGTGTGTVTSYDTFGDPHPVWIDCGEDCSAALEEGGEFTLSAEADPGSVFLGWSGACSGTGKCEVTLSEDEVVVVARFHDVRGSGPTPPASEDGP